MPSHSSAAMADLVVSLAGPGDLIRKINKIGINLDVALKEHPDLILLDIILPKLDGISVLKQLRVHQWGKSVPIIVLSNLSRVVTEKQVADDEVKDYLVKAEWDVNDVVKKVNEVLG